jgi:hypothetical protein
MKLMKKKISECIGSMAAAGSGTVKKENRPSVKRRQPVKAME